MASILKKNSRFLRPRLWILSPVIYYIVVGFIVLNFCFGYSLWYSPNRATYIVENSVMSHQVWGLVFAALSFGLILGLFLNKHRIVKNFLICGLAVKFVWWFAFIALAVQKGFDSTIAALGFWFFVSMIQMVAILFFPPTEQEIRKEISERIANGALADG